MLVLSRKVGERIKIGDDIEIIVVEIDRGTVRLGIKAPRSTKIYREELLKGQQLQQQQQQRQGEDNGR